MLQLKPLDDNVPIFQQIGTEVSPVVLVNVFHVAKEDIPCTRITFNSPALPIKPRLRALVTVPTAMEPALITTTPPTFTSPSTRNVNRSPSPFVAEVIGSTNNNGTSVPSGMCAFAGTTGATGAGPGSARSGPPRE